VGAANPFRYRGYYWDSETGLFYVGSRYYDPEIGRFINADTTEILNNNFVHILENNLFAYCFNNPVMHYDPDGEFAAAAGVLTYGMAAGAANSWHPGGWVILGVVAVAAVGVGIYYLAKGGKQRIKDSGWIGQLSDAELNRLYNDPSTSKSDRQKMKKEQKARQQRQSSQKKKSSNKKK
jgi:RHS repeat-associated protein